MGLEPKNYTGKTLLEKEPTTDRLLVLKYMILGRASFVYLFKALRTIAIEGINKKLIFLNCKEL